MEEKRIIEVNGIKLEVDLRNAKRVDVFKIGSKVKLLKNEGYSDKTHHIYPGVVVGFEEFEKLPTIVVMYLKDEYSNAGVNLQYINSETKDTEIIAADDDYLPFEKEEVVEKMNREIAKKEIELQELNRKKEYFLTRFAEAFMTVKVEV